jgi:hypothetical protein
MMKNLESKHNKNDKWLFKKENVSVNELKALSLSTPNDTEFGNKIREMLWSKDDMLIDANKDVSEDGGIFGKISGPQYKELIEGYQSKSGEEFNEWYSELNKEEKVFISNMFD